MTNSRKIHSYVWLIENADCKHQNSSIYFRYGSQILTNKTLYYGWFTLPDSDTDSDSDCKPKFSHYPKSVSDSHPSTGSGLDLGSGSEPVNVNKPLRFMSPKIFTKYGWFTYAKKGDAMAKSSTNWSLTISSIFTLSDNKDQREFSDPPRFHNLWTPRVHKINYE